MPSASDRKPDGRFNFTGLPLEIRRMIYAHSVTADRPIGKQDLFDYMRGTASNPVIPAFTTFNKKCRLEAFEAFIGNNTIDIQCYIEKYGLRFQLRNVVRSASIHPHKDHFNPSFDDERDFKALMLLHSTGNIDTLAHFRNGFAGDFSALIQFRNITHITVNVGEVQDDPATGLDDVDLPTLDTWWAELFTTTLVGALKHVWHVKYVISTDESALWRFGDVFVLVGIAVTAIKTAGMDRRMKLTIENTQVHAKESDEKIRNAWNRMKIIVE